MSSDDEALKMLARAIARLEELLDRLPVEIAMSQLSPVSRVPFPQVGGVLTVPPGQSGVPRRRSLT